MAGNRAMEWIWLRHAPTAKVGRFCGQTDVAAMAVPKATYAGIVSHIPANARVFVSPLTRATQTLDGLLDAGLSPIECTTNDLIREQHFGDFENTPYADVTLPGDKEGLAQWRAPDGESFGDVVVRVGRFLSQELADDSEEPRLVVTHAGVIRAALTIASDMPAADGLSFAIDTLSLTAISRTSEGSWRIKYINSSIGERHVAIG